MQLFDTHCHLDVPAFDSDRDAVLRRARSAGVTGQLIPAIQAAGWDNLLRLCDNEPDLYPALGLHPVFIDQHEDEHLDALQRKIEEVRPVAVGEIGLDFYLTELDVDRQIEIFEAQLAIAHDLRLPAILHVRKAHDQTIPILKRSGVARGIVHAFNGSLQQGKKYFDMGFRLGFGGMLTFERSTKLRRLAAELPLDAIVLETDAPDLTVSSHQGERNSPEYLPEVLTALIQLRRESRYEIAERTTENAKRILGI